MRLLGLWLLTLVAGCGCSSVTTTTTTTSTTALEDMFMPFDDWVCGSSGEESWIAYERTNESCADVGQSVNNCCHAHDNCYGDDTKSQADCDVPFCACIAAEGARSGNPECRDLMESFCYLVELFGSIAKHSKEHRENNGSQTSTTPSQPSTNNESEYPTTPTQLQPSTTPNPTQFHDLTEDECFEHDISKCLHEFDTCRSAVNHNLTRCETQMCSCTRSQLRHLHTSCQESVDRVCPIGRRDVDEGTRIEDDFDVVLYPLAKYLLYALPLFCLIFACAVTCFHSRLSSQTEIEKPSQHYLRFVPSAGSSLSSNDSFVVVGSFKTTP